MKIGCGKSAKVLPLAISSLYKQALANRRTVMHGFS